MNKLQNQKFIGYFLKRKDIHNISVVDLQRELQYHLFEANILQKVIQYIQKNEFSVFDSSVGDWKCQTRTSMIIDYLNNQAFIKQELSEAFITINAIIINLGKLVEKINFYTCTQLKKLTEELHTTSLQQFINQHKLNYNPSEKLVFFCLIFLTTLKNTNLPIFTNHQISVNKWKMLINIAKRILCRLSIEYEQNLTQIYGKTNEQIALQQIESKNIQEMTSLFVSFKSIFQKMKVQQQPFITETIQFCVCDGVQSIQIKFFKPKNNHFIESTLPENLTQAITVIRAYQFPGSLEQLFKLLHIPNYETAVLPKFYQPCLCTNSFQQKTFNSIDEAIMAFFAQHPQFTNGAEIDFKKFGLEDSDLKKEYDHLKTLKGFSRDDMSKFQIIHMYPSTIADVLKEQEEIEAQLKSKKI